MPDLDYQAESDRLTDLARTTIGAEATQRKIAVASARYQLDQAVSLAIMADNIEALVAHVVGHVPPAAGTESDAAPEQAWTLATEAEAGDFVAVRVLGEAGESEPHPDTVAPEKVTEVGTSEGDIWLKLENSDAKVWGKDFVIVEGRDDADEELADRIQAESEEDLAVDDDFAAPERPVDGFAALKGKKAAKKGGK